MKKIIILTLVLTFSLAFLTSCHGRKRIPLFEVPEEFDESEDYHITFWAKNDSNRVQREIYQNAIKSFESFYPNIHVELVNYSDYTKIYEDVLRNIPTNTTPNVCIGYPDHVATYLSGDGVVAPITDLISNEKYGLGGSKLKFKGIKKDEVTKKFFDEGIINNEYYMLPFMRSTEALYINKTYLEENGFEIPAILTWDYVWEVCEFAHEDGIKYPMIYKSTDNMFIQMAKQKNIPYSNDKGDILVFNDETKSLLTELQGHAKVHFETFKRKSYPGNYFNREECIFAIDSTAGATWIGSDAPLIDIKPEEVKEFETVVRPVPQVDINQPRMISQGPSICLFNKANDQEVLASWLFAQFLLTNDVQLPYSHTEGYLPVTETAINSQAFKDYLNDKKEYQVKIDATKLILDYTQKTFTTPVFKGSSLLRSASGEMIEKVFDPRYQGDKGIDKIFEYVKGHLVI